MDLNELVTDVNELNKRAADEAYLSALAAQQGAEFFRKHLQKRAAATYERIEAEYKALADGKTSADS